MVSREEKNKAFWQKYRRYLKTDRWFKKRLALGYKVNFRCEKCGIDCRNKFEVHHKTYRRVFKEPLSDLMFLCPECHRLIEARKRQRGL